MVQLQLFQIPLDEGDVVCTPDWVAKDMVEFFKPSGRILEPCKGDGVFLKYLPPDTQWCEIQEGRDFFAWNEPVDWIIGNPPYKIFGEWFSHSVTIAKNICYLMPIHFFFRRGSSIDICFEWGMYKEMRIYGGGAKLGFPMGNPIAAFHFQKGYTGSMYSSIYDE